MNEIIFFLLGLSQSEICDALLWGKCFEGREMLICKIKKNYSNYHLIEKVLSKVVFKDSRIKELLLHITAKYL